MCSVKVTETGKVEASQQRLFFICYLQCLGPDPWIRPQSHMHMRFKSRPKSTEDTHPSSKLLCQSGAACRTM